MSVPGLEDSLRYLSSELALDSIDANVYWPKWDSPWWHLSLLYELGEIKRAPAAVIQRMVRGLAASPTKFFPIHPHEMPTGLDGQLSTHCHCALGNMYQVLAAWGVPVDEELPWIRPWFLRYQMADGGLNCDERAYLVEGECASSMVGTIAPFEAVLFHTPRPFTPEELAFLERGARFLQGRRLTQGSDTEFNAEEQHSAASWSKLCFPRFYLYDVLRGLNALLGWREKTGGQVDEAVVEPIFAALERRFPDGQIRLERRAYDGIGTRYRTPSREWIRKKAELTTLLVSVSAVGDVSVPLTRQWAALRSQWTARG